MAAEVMKWKLEFNVFQRYGGVLLMLRDATEVDILLDTAGLGNRQEVQD